MTRGTYQIDEPGVQRGYAVSPLWPLLALMLCGAWLAWPWAIFNAHALKSPTRRSETAWAVIGLIGSVLLALAVLWWSAQAGDDASIERRLRYAFIGLTVWKLVCGYRIYMLQSRTVELYEFYGGVLRSAFPLLIVGLLARGYVVAAIPFVFMKLALG